MRRITQKDIARKLGISVMTVSRVVNNSKYVSEKTREKVLKLIEKENYFPNSIAKALRTNKIFSIGVIIRYTGNIFSIPYFIQLLEGIEETCIEKNYDIVISPWGETKFEYQRIFSSRKADGFVILAPGIHDEEIKNLKKNSYIPYVIINNIGDFHYVTTDNFRGAYEMTKYLIECGYKNIAFVKGLPFVRDSIERYDGYKKAFEDFNKKLDENLIFNSGYAFEDGLKLADEIIKLKKKPDAIFACNDMMALGLIKKLKEYGIKIPDDIGIAGFDNILQAEYASLTTVDQQISLIGKKAAEILINLIENNKKNIKNYFQVKIPTKLIIRQTTKKLNN